MLTNDEFLKHLRNALKHLYNPDFLRQSPLSKAFGVADRFDTSMALQRILTEAIQAMRPGGAMPEGTQAWNTYDILLYRYIQQLTQDQVANQLGVSSRQLAREQEIAIDVLAERLWEQYQMGEMDAISIAQTTLDVEEAANNLSNELRWLEETPNQQGTNLVDEIHAVLNLVSPLAEFHEVTLDLMAVGDIPDILIHPVALRQILVSVVNLAIDQSAGGSSQIQVSTVEKNVEVVITGSNTTPILELSENDQASMAMTEQLINLSKGKTAYSFAQAPFSIQLIFPPFKTVTVLAIDDNPDFLELFRRYTHSTHFRLIGTRDPRQAIDLAILHSPDVIVLDVMMPEMDGWQLLSRLRRHPSCGNIPILICSIVQQEELARTLGARGFLRKPVTRKDLLVALDLLVENEAPGSY